MIRTENFEKFEVASLEAPGFGWRSIMVNLAEHVSPSDHRKLLRTYLGVTTVTIGHLYYEGDCMINLNFNR